MIRGLYLATDGMLTQERRIDVVIHNLSHAETVGFKEDKLLTQSFEDQMVARVYGYDTRHATPIGPFSSGVFLDETTTLFTPGPFEETGLDTDLAIEGDGFFVVTTPKGPRYTKAGHFTVSAEGYLVTPEGYTVQGQQGPIQTNGQPFSVDQNGLVRTVNGTSQLQLVRFADLSALRKEGENLYSSQTAPEQGGVMVRQGFLEQSNVDLADQVTNLILIQRQYELNQRVLRLMDERLGHSVNEIARI